MILGDRERLRRPAQLRRGRVRAVEEMMAATTVTIAPTLALFLVIQGRLAGGLTAGAVRG
jgi:multiple sugar transport system permease protein